MGTAYTRRIEGLAGLQLPVERSWARSVYWMYGVVLRDRAGMDATAFAEKLADRGILSPVFAMWSPNVLFGVMALLLLRGAARERTVTQWNFSSLLKLVRRNAATNSR